jgi:hypothetical protein
MNKITALLLGLSMAGCVWASTPPRLVVPADSNSFNTPLYSRDDSNLAFTDTTLNRLFIAPLSGKKIYTVAQALRIGRRFIFEPVAEGRLAYRQMVLIENTSHDRIMSTSFYLFDPISRTRNSGRIIGPYLIEGKVWYRTSLLEPYADYQGNLRIAGGYLDTDKGKLWVINLSRDTVYASPQGTSFAAFEISPDGKFIAAVQEKPQPFITVIEVETGRYHELGSGLWPSWSGDSHSLVYLTPPSDAVASTMTEIRVYRLNGGTRETVLASSAYEPKTPALNSDGTRVAFSSKGAIYELVLAH